MFVTLALLPIMVTASPFSLVFEYIYLTFVILSFHHCYLNQGALYNGNISYFYTLPTVVSVILPNVILKDIGALHRQCISQYCDEEIIF